MRVLGSAIALAGFASAGKAKIGKIAKMEIELAPLKGSATTVSLSVGLFDEELPKTSENFEWACENHFANTVFHRVIRGFMAQGGDFTNHNGTGGKSKWGDRFDDEGFSQKHEARGMLSMANAGKNTNGSQFFITFKPTSWLDGRHVVFGCMTDGFDGLDKIEAMGSDNGKPNGKITIKSCKVKPAPENASCGSESNNKTRSESAEL